MYKAVGHSAYYSVDYEAISKSRPQQLLKFTAHGFNDPHNIDTIAGAARRKAGCPNMSQEFHLQ